MAKRKTSESITTEPKKTQSKNSAVILRYVAWTLAIIALVLTSMVVGYYFGYNDANSDVKKLEKQNLEQRVSAIAKIEKSLQKNTQERAQKSVNKKLQEVLRQQEVKPKYVSASHEFDYSEPKLVPEAIPRPIQVSSLKPRLAIIIDDVGTKSQVNAINRLNIALTKSFLPPSHNRPNTPTLAANENFYMVHLPMEAQRFSAEEPNTLRIHDSQEKISSKIKEIKRLFPKVAYINNHTGSKFTADEIAMNRLIFALKANNIYFVDSRTTADTKAPKVMKNFGLKYVARDVFLDHHMDKDYIKSQIKIAIKSAKQHGSAIAIGHPHRNTLEALEESKSLLRDVELVYVSQIY